MELIYKLKVHRPFLHLQPSKCVWQRLLDGTYINQKSIERSSTFNLTNVNGNGCSMERSMKKKSIERSSTYNLAAMVTQ
jgi:hypothetical protein